MSLPKWLFVALLMLAPAPSPGHAQSAPEAPDYAHVPGMNHLWHWARFPLRVFVATHDAAEDQAARSALAGFDEWVRATGGAVRYVVVDGPARADLVVRFVAMETLPGQPGIGGETDDDARDGVLRHAAMTLATGGATPAELQSVAAHEFGHVLGIGGHSDDPADLMYPTETRVFTADGMPVDAPPRPVTARDLNTLRACYPGLPVPPER